MQRVTIFIYEILFVTLASVFVTFVLIPDTVLLIYLASSHPIGRLAPVGLTLVLWLKTDSLTGILRATLLFYQFLQHHKNILNIPAVAFYLLL